jgi:hypothetical protein
MVIASTKREAAMNRLLLGDFHCSSESSSEWRQKGSRRRRVDARGAELQILSAEKGKTCQATFSDDYTFDRALSHGRAGLIQYPVNLLGLFFASRRKIGWPSFESRDSGMSLLLLVATPDVSSDSIPSACHAPLPSSPSP